MPYISIGLFVIIIGLGVAYRALLLENAELDGRLKKAHENIEKQNKEIHARALDIKEYQKDIIKKNREIAAKYKNVKAEAQQETCEHKINEIRGLLKGFN